MSSNNKTSTSESFERGLMDAVKERKRVARGGKKDQDGEGDGGAPTRSTMGASGGSASSFGGAGSGGYAHGSSSSATHFKKLRAFLDRLGKNDEKFNSIDFCKEKYLFAYCWKDDDLFGELLGILRTNTQIATVHLDPTLLRRMPKEQLEVLFEAIGSVENLNELNFTSTTGQASVLDIHLLRAALGRCSDRLQSLRLHSIRPHGQEEDVEDLIKTMSTCTALEKFEFYITSTSSIDLDVFVRAINYCPNIQQIRMISSLRKRTAWLTGGTIGGYFCSSPTLKQLTLRNQRLTKEHIPDICDALRTNTVLEFLDLDGNNLGDEGITILANRMLNKDAENYSSLIELDISENWFSDDGVIAISNALVNNASLSIINLQQNMMTKPALDSLIRMLKYNFYLEELEIDKDHDEDVLDAIEFYLQMNNDVNRSNLLCLVDNPKFKGGEGDSDNNFDKYQVQVNPESNTEDWINSILQYCNDYESEEDLSTVYYLLRSNPSLCE